MVWACEKDTDREMTKDYSKIRIKMNRKARTTLYRLRNECRGLRPEK